MNRSMEDFSHKRKREQAPQPEDIILKLIRDKKDEGIFRGDLKRDSKLVDASLTKAIKNLLTDKRIKEVVNMKNKAKKHYIASEFEPSKEITGGDWYLDGNLDNDFIKALRTICLRFIMKMKVATADGIYDFIKKSNALNVNCSLQQIKEILGAMVLDNEIIEVKSTGLAEFHSIPVGTICYKSASGMGIEKGPKIGRMVAIPCGVCPRISQCEPGGLISPDTCGYYKAYLENLKF